MGAEGGKGRIKNKLLETLRYDLLYLQYKDMKMNDLQTKYEKLKEEYFNELAKDNNEFNENEFNRLGKLLDNQERLININNQFEDKKL